MRFGSSLVTVLVTCICVSTSAADSDLLPKLYEHLPVGSIKPTGWAKSQAQVQAAGVAGQQMDFYSYVKNTTWTGGAVEYSEMHESKPYWFNGIVALAFQLEDQKLIRQAQTFLDYIIEHQQADGWIGPELPTLMGPLGLFGLGISFSWQYAEASRADTERIVHSMHLFVSLVHELWTTGKYGTPDLGFQFDYQYVRHEELVYSLQWLYDYHPRGKQSELLETMKLVRSTGADWKNEWYTPAAFPKAAVTQVSHYTHGVNIAESLKSEAQAYRFTHDASDIQSTTDRLTMLYKYHGQATGTFAADEHLAGLNPSRGTELCTIVEQMFSLALVWQAFGDNAVADRVEQIAYNALPGAITYDWWGHQYDTQVNQVWSRNMTNEKPFYVNSGYSNVYGLEPNDPCCVVNFPQGYPKFWSNSLVTGSSGSSLIHALLGPAEYSGILKSGKEVTVQVDTEYPFGSQFTYTINASEAFVFAIRVPGWTQASQKSTISVNGAAKIALVPDATSSLHTVQIKSGLTKLQVNLDMQIRVEERSNGAIAVHRGPLNYAVEIPYNDTLTPAWRNPQALEYIRTLPNVSTSDETSFIPVGHDHVLLPTNAWQIAIDPSTLKFSTTGAKVPFYAWAPGAPPVSLTAKGCVIAWGVELDSAASPPASPNTCVGRVQDVKLVPYGSSKLRIGEIPTMTVN